MFVTGISKWRRKLVLHFDRFGKSNFTFNFAFPNDESPQVIVCSSNLNRSMSHVDSPTETFIFAKKAFILRLFLKSVFIFRIKRWRHEPLSLWRFVLGKSNFQFFKAFFPCLWIAPVWELSVSIIGRNDEVDKTKAPILFDLDHCGLFRRKLLTFSTYFTDPCFVYKNWASFGWSQLSNRANFGELKETTTFRYVFALSV